MPRIKIKDLPEDQKISKDELKRVIGGVDSRTYFGIPGESTDKYIKLSVAGAYDFAFYKT